MKRAQIFIAFAFMLLLMGLVLNPAVAQQAEHGSGFVDENGDGYNDNAPDHDGDGIPNGQDADFTAPGNQTGKKAEKGFVDEDGDGVNDNAPDADGDGIPNGQDSDYEKPADGQGQQMDNQKAGRAKGPKGQVVKGFVDEDGDGFNDNAPDADTDGIPNGRDADWERPEDCLGRGARLGNGFKGGNNDGNAGDDSGNGNGGSGRGGKGKGGRG